MRFCLIDVPNLVHRAKHISLGRPMTFMNLDEEVEIDKRREILHIVFASFKRAFEKFQCQHTVVAFDSYSWRHEIYPPYKMNRKKKPRSPTELKVDESMKQAVKDLKFYLREKTNATVLDEFGLEADDFIGRWVNLHGKKPFENIIISGDRDFRQLIRKNTAQYDPIQQILYTHKGVFYQDRKPISKATPTRELFNDIWKVKLNKKGKPEKLDPRWDLFEKEIRGDASDNITSAWPRISKTKMKNALYGTPLEWNNFINSVWGPEHNRQSVRERYERNRILIDLTAQPDGIRELIDKTIREEIARPKKTMIEHRFIHFCTQNGLHGLRNQARWISPILSTAYQNDQLDFTPPTERPSR